MLLRTLFFLLFWATGASSALSQSFYFGLNGGLFISGDDYFGEIHTEFGRRWKDRFGLGIAYTGSLGGGTSTSYGIGAAGLQGRLELDRWLVSLDAGTVLGASHSTDWFCNRTYQPEFDPYFRPALSYRLGALTLGMSGVFTTPLRFTEYDEEVNMEEPEICYGREYLESFQRFTLTLGISFPSRKRKGD